MNPIALVDVDGVCADFIGHLQEKLRSEGLVLPMPAEWDFFKTMSTNMEIRSRQILKDVSFWESLPEIHLARDSIYSLKSIGWDVVFLTSPYYACVGWESARRSWIHRTFGIDGHNVIFASRKDLVFGNIFIDDRKENVESWVKRHPDGLGFLFKQPYNKGDGQWDFIIQKICKIHSDNENKLSDIFLKKLGVEIIK